MKEDHVKEILGAYATTIERTLTLEERLERLENRVEDLWCMYGNNYAELEYDLMKIRKLVKQLTEKNKND